MHEDGRGCIFRGKVVLRHPLRNSGSKPYHLSTKTGELHTEHDWPDPEVTNFPITKLISQEILSLIHI